MRGNVNTRVTRVDGVFGVTSLKAATLLAALACCMPVAQAQFLYSCRDANGQMVTSDRPLMECSDRAQQQRSRSGNVVREIPAPLTPAQKAAEEERKVKAHRAEAALQEEIRKDRLLLSSYPDVAAIDAARMRRLAEAESNVASSKNRLTLLERERNTLESEVKANPGKAPAPSRKRRLDALIASEVQEQRMLVERSKEIDRINAKFDEDKVRYEALTVGKFPR